MNILGKTIVTIASTIGAFVLLLFFGAIFFIARVIYYNIIPECNYANPILNEYPIDSKEYNAEIVKEFKRIENLETEFWMKSYSDTNKTLIMEFHNEEICGLAEVEIRKNTYGLKNFLRVKGVSYSGYFKGMKVEMDDNPQNPTLVFKSVDAIIE